MQMNRILQRKYELKFYIIRVIGRGTYMIMCWSLMIAIGMCVHCFATRSYHNGLVFGLCVGNRLLPIFEIQSASCTLIALHDARSFSFRRVCNSEEIMIL